MFQLYQSHVKSPVHLFNVEAHDNAKKSKQGPEKTLPVKAEAKKDKLPDSLTAVAKQALAGYKDGTADDFEDDEDETDWRQCKYCSMQFKAPNVS